MAKYFSAICECPYLALLEKHLAALTTGDVTDKRRKDRNTNVGARLMRRETLEDIDKCRFTGTITPGDASMDEIRPQPANFASSVISDLATLHCRHHRRLRRGKGGGNCATPPHSSGRPKSRANASQIRASFNRVIDCYGMKFGPVWFRFNK